MLLFFASAGDPNELLKKLDEALALGVDVNLTVRLFISGAVFTLCSLNYRGNT